MIATSAAALSIARMLAGRLDGGAISRLGHTALPRLNPRARLSSVLIGSYSFEKP